MLIVAVQHNITDGNISSTVLGSILANGKQEIVGTLATSPGTDHTATVAITLITPIGNFVISTPLFPSVLVPISIPLIISNPSGALEYSVAVTGTDGSYQLFIGVKD